MKVNLSSSLEDYLEAIININDKEGRVRITDISRELKVEKSSVNSAVKKLQNLGLVLHEKYGDIRLTRKGEEEAGCIRERHDIIMKFLIDFLGLRPKEAERDACRIEHVISSNTFKRLSGFINFLESSTFFNKKKWLESFDRYIETGEYKAEEKVH
jgi:DtxR family Mn-dependent transcriptional regulator